MVSLDDVDVRGLTVAAAVVYLVAAGYALATNDATATLLTDATFSLVMVGFGVLLRVRNPGAGRMRVAGGLFVAAGLVQAYLLVAADPAVGDGAVSLLLLAAFSLYVYEVFVRPRIEAR
ncbi:hypothetical protein [Halostella litorea]|uniref:hypothetical protein n=1 Tax=Halostella litorea TaxID=2528831 RepID=UPI001092ECB6|nr:hypothetical protein [Halostella litorea]